MAACMEVGDVVYRRAKVEEDSDLWDDTALIKAYDNAVSSIRDKLREDTANNGDILQSKASKKHRKSNKKKKQRNSQDSMLWRVGNRCWAIYSEDDQLYEAVIKSVDAEAETCIVRYCGYGNEEEQKLIDLLPSMNVSHKTSVSDRVSDLPSEIESVEGDDQSGQSSRDESRRPPKPRSGTSTGRQHHSRDTHPSRPSAPPNMFPPVGPQSWPGYPGRVPPPLAPFGFGWPSMGTHSNIPPIPPPPPIPDTDSAIDDKEALYSMLIAWYMSGYHTGYYQGLKQKQQVNVDIPSDG